MSQAKPPDGEAGGKYDCGWGWLPAQPLECVICACWQVGVTILTANRVENPERRRNGRFYPPFALLAIGMEPSVAFQRTLLDLGMQRTIAFVPRLAYGLKVGHGPNESGQRKRCFLRYQTLDADPAATPILIMELRSRILIRHRLSPMLRS